MQESDPTKHRILLVEDEALVALTQKRTIQAYGYEVFTAHSGEKAVEIATGESSPDLILMDIDLGEGKDGTQAAEEIMAVRSVPIVFLTAHTEKEYVDRVKSITSYGYVVKNSGEFVLMESIEKAFQLFAAHEETRRQEEKYRLIAENSSEVVATFDRKMRPKYVSPSIESLLGYTPDEFLRLAPRHLLTDDSLTRIREAGKSRAAHDGEPIYLELECVHKNGDRAWCEAFTKPLLDGHSEVIGTIAAIRNITERKEAEHALKASERRYREYVDNAPVAFFVSNAAGKHLDVNRAATSLLGYTREELMALPVQVLDVTDDASGTDALQYLKRNGYIRGERQPRHKHGHSVDVLLEAVAISDDRYMAYCQDITHQKNTERRLELYKQAIQSSDDLVAAVDKGYRYMMASPAYLQQHRIDEQDLLGTHVADILGSEAFREVVQPRLDQALNGERLSYEMSLRYPDGVLHEVHVSYYPLRDAEHVTGVIAQIRDIHEIKNR